MRCGSRSRFENISFSNLIMKNVTGPISIGLDSSYRRPPRTRPRPPVKELSAIFLSGNRATVVSGRQYADMPFPASFRPGESKSCIALNGVGSDFLEEISFNNVHVTMRAAARLKRHRSGTFRRERRILRTRNLAGVRSVCPQCARPHAARCAL